MECLNCGSHSIEWQEGKTEVGRDDQGVAYTWQWEQVCLRCGAHGDDIVEEDE